MEDMMKQGMGMMKNMMGQGGKDSGNGMGGMMEMCTKMTQSVTKSAEMASFATEEIHGLFQDWLNQVETEVLSFVKSNGGTIDIAAIASQLSISEKSARYIVGVLFQRGVLNLGQVHVQDTQVNATPTEQREEPTNLQEDVKKDE